MRRQLAIAILLLLTAVCIHAQQQGLGGTGGTGGTAGYQSNNARMVITTNSLADATANAAYAQTLTANNGVSPFTWTIMLGSLPSGMTLASSTGVISGTPTVVGNYTFTVLLTDSTSPTAQTATQQLSIAVVCAPLQLISQSPLPSGTQGSSYSFQFQSVGGLGTVTWSNPGGGIPTGTTLSSGGLLSGTLTVAGAYNFNIAATDSCPTPQIVSHPFVVQVNNTLRITTISPLPDGVVGSLYSTQMSASGGTAPYTWTVASGTLPAGLTLASTGLISGTPTQAVTRTVTIQVTDNLGITNNSQFTITTSCTALSITSGAALPNATQGQPYSTQLLSAGGTGTVTWSLLSGTLDPGLTLATNGLITGVPSSPGSYNPTIQVQDSCSPTPQTQSQAFTLSVAQQLTITTNSLPAGVQGVPYAAQVSAQGGVPPYIWSVPSGPVPAGAVDLTNGWWLMASPDRYNFHMAGGSNPRYSVLNAGLAMGIKSNGGMPQDGRWYDGDFLYFGITDNGDNADQAACIAAGYPGGCFLDPFAYKLALNLRPFSPRYFVLGGLDVTINDPAPNMGVSTTNCGVDNHTPRDLGNVATVIHDAGSGTNWGGDVGSCRTVIFNYYRSLTTLTPPYQSGTRERYYACYPYGVFNYDAGDWNGTSYGPPFQIQNLNNLKVTGGAPTPNFGCGIPTPPVQGRLPAGVLKTSSTSFNLVDATGAITGTPSSSGTSVFIVQVEDSVHTITQKQLSIVTTCPALTLSSTSPLQQGTVNQAYSFQFLASGGATPRAWQVIAGALPNGLALTSAGLLAGTPTQTGTFNVTVQVMDSCSPQPQSAQKNFTLAIAANSGVLTIATTTPLPQGTEQQAYSQQLQATGGTTPYVWTLVSGSLPTGITLTSAGLISGTPTATSVSSFTVRVTDAIAGTTTKVLSLTVVCPAIAIISTSPLPPGTVGQAYSFQFASSGGIAPITWTATGVPAGLTLSSAGLLAGTPTAAATSTINVTAHDSCVPTPQTPSASFSLTVNAAVVPVAITSTSPLAGATEGKAYNNQLTASGGTPPYTWSITSGALQTGLTLSTAGLIAGTPTTASTVTPTFKVLDSIGGTASQVLSLTVTCPVFSVSSTSPLPTATQNQPYSFQFTSSGGMGTITWTSAAWPTGLTLSSGGLLSGTPTGTGTSTVNVTATDACAPTPQAVGPTGYAITINAATVPLQITTGTTLPPGTINQAYSTTLAATGGTPPYGTWTVTSGALPTGLTLHAATGIIDGTPTVLQTTTPTVRVADNVAATASKAFSITINAASTADNRYCNTNETTNFSLPNDGPATLPQRCVRTAIADTPAAGPTKTVCASGCDYTTLQAAVNAASAGWIIQLKATTGGVQSVFAGAAISGLHGTATNWIWIETDQTASLPTEGTRISPAFVGKPTLPGRPTYTQPATPGIYLPKIRGGNNLLTVTNSSFIRLIGLEVTTTSGTNVTNITTGTTSDHIIFDRFACHGGDSATWQDRDSVTRCFSWSGMTYSAVIDSYLADTHCVVGGTCTDSQAILAGGNSASPEGPFKFVNNFMETAAEPILFGGGGANAATTVPCDLEIRRNHFFKPLFWKVNDPSYFGTNMEVKNNSEMKTGCRALWEGDILDTTWKGQADQNSFQFLLGPKNQSSAFGGTASSNGAGSITKLTGAFAFNALQVSPLCAIPLHCNFKYNGIVYPTNTVIDGTHITVGPNRATGLLPPVNNSAAFLAFQPGQNPNATVNNITVRYNRYMHSGNGYEIFVQASDGGDNGKGMYNVSIHDDLWDDVDGAKWCSYPAIANCGFAWSLALGQISNDTPAPNNLHDVTIKHVTGVVRDSFSSFPPGSIGPGIAYIHQSAAATSISNLKIYDNILPAGLVLDQPGACGGSRIKDANASFNCVTSVGGVGPTSGCFDHNALAVTTATTGTTSGTSNNPPYPSASPNCPFAVSGNFLPASYNAVQFTNLNGGIGGNYQLLVTSPYHNAASDGKDVGADINAVNAATSGVN